jgi:hypothetical protein
MPPFVRLDGADQAIDILGSLLQTDSLNISDEPSGYGQPTGISSNCTITFSGSNGTVFFNGATSSNILVGQFVTITNSVGNNGSYLITSINPGFSFNYAALSGVNDLSGNAHFVIRNPYSLQDDINYIRTDRKLIKGTTNWYDSNPLIDNADGTTTISNLANLALVTTSVKNVIISELVLNQGIATSATHITIPFVSNNGDSWITTNTNKVGIPVFDAGLYQNDMESCFVIITNSLNGNEISNDSNLIFGITKKGSATGNNVEVWFYSISPGSSITSATPYTWQSTDPTNIDLAYPHSFRLDQVPSNAFRRITTLGLMSDADIRSDITNLQLLVGLGNQTGIVAVNVNNSSNYYPFSNLNLVGSGSTIMQALNTLNDNVGNMTFTGSILDGPPGSYTVTSALQTIANNISAVSLTRVVERITTTIPANTIHYVPAGIGTYNLDPTNNGAGLLVYVRGTERYPGTLINKDDYIEIAVPGSTTHGNAVQFFFQLFPGDHISYLKLS